MATNPLKDMIARYLVWRQSETARQYANVARVSRPESGDELIDNARLGPASRYNRMVAQSRQAGSDTDKNWFTRIPSSLMGLLPTTGEAFQPQIGPMGSGLSPVGLDFPAMTAGMVPAVAANPAKFVDENPGLVAMMLAGHGVAQNTEALKRLPLTAANAAIDYMVPAGELGKATIRTKNLLNILGKLSGLVPQQAKDKIPVDYRTFLHGMTRSGAPLEISGGKDGLFERLSLNPKRFETVHWPIVRAVLEGRLNRKQAYEMANWIQAQNINTFSTGDDMLLTQHLDPMIYISEHFPEVVGRPVQPIDTYGGPYERALGKAYAVRMKDGTVKVVDRYKFMKDFDKELSEEHPTTEINRRLKYAAAALLEPNPSWRTNYSRKEVAANELRRIMSSRGEGFLGQVLKEFPVSVKETTSLPYKTQPEALALANRSRARNYQSALQTKWATSSRVMYNAQDLVKNLKEDLERSQALNGTTIYDKAALARIKSAERNAVRTRELHDKLLKKYTDHVEKWGALTLYESEP